MLKGLSFEIWYLILIREGNQEVTTLTIHNNLNLSDRPAIRILFYISTVYAQPQCAIIFLMHRAVGVYLHELIAHGWVTVQLWGKKYLFVVLVYLVATIFIPVVLQSHL